MGPDWWGHGARPWGWGQRGRAGRVGHGGGAMEASQQWAGSTEWALALGQSPRVRP